MTRWRNVWHFLLAILLASSAPIVHAEIPFIYGVGTHFPKDQSTVDTGMRLVQRAGLNSYRDDIYWHIVEAQSGVFKYPDFYERPVSSAQGAGIEPVLIFGRMSGAYKWRDGWSHKPVGEEKRKAFARYASAVVRHYQGKVSLFELWNEWNQSEEPKTLEPYLALLKVVSPAVREANPEAHLLLGSSNPEGIERTWLPPLLAAGVNDLVDGYSIHPYVHCEGGRKATPEGWFDWLSGVLARLDGLAGGKLKPVYITEMSWPAHHGACGVSEQTQAMYLAKLFVLAPFLPHVKGVWWYDLQNDGSDPANMEHNFGLLDQEMKPKPAYLVARNLVPVLVSKTAARLVNLDGLWVAAFKGSDGEQLYAVWQEQSVWPRKLRLVSVRGVSRLDWSSNAWLAAGRAELAVSGVPLIMKGRQLAFDVLQNDKLLRTFRALK